MKILVVDDDNTALAIARKILQIEGHEVITAGDGRKALEILENDAIPVVISDWNMPEMDGIDLCKTLRSMTSIGYIYIILVTSRSSKEEMLAGLAAGANDFVSKPFEPAELRVRVRNAESILALDTTFLTLFSLAKLAESKDPDTGRHLERIRAFAKLLTEQIMATGSSGKKLPPRFADLIYQTSPLHDIGKVGIPDYVLLKPGNLSDEEWQIMKQHPTIGAETLDAALKTAPSAEFLRIARDIAWAHHERWDGTGYPRGLKGIEIPLCARIVALADVYDALANKRVYKSAIPHHVARGIILEGSGKHFDPAIVQAFLGVEDQFISTRDDYKD